MKSYFDIDPAFVTVHQAPGTLLQFVLPVYLFLGVQAGRMQKWDEGWKTTIVHACYDFGNPKESMLT